MNDHTVLVVDAGQDAEETIVSSLEAKGYLVFTASGRDVSTGLAEKINPELIYLQPTGNSVEGFAVCKAIHNAEKFRDVPIILIASLKGPLDSRYTTFYGIVDYLSIPVRVEELVRKTEKILGVSSMDVQVPEEGIWPDEETEAPIGERSISQDEYAIDAGIKEVPFIGHSGDEDIGAVEEDNVIAKAKSEIQEKIALDMDADGVSDIGEPNQNYTYNEDQEELRTVFSVKGHTGRRKKPGNLNPFIVVSAVLIVVAAASFLFYRLYLSPSEVKAPVAVEVPKVVQPQGPAVSPSPEQQELEQAAVAETTPETMDMPKQPPVAQQETSKELPVSQSEVKPVAKQIAKPVYSVQLGAFKNEVSAGSLAKTFKGKGHEAFTYTETTTDKGTIHRVLIGKFASRKEALHLATQIHKKENVDTTVFGGVIK